MASPGAPCLNYTSPKHLCPPLPRSLSSLPHFRPFSMALNPSSLHRCTASSSLWKPGICSSSKLPILSHSSLSLYHPYPGATAGASDLNILVYLFCHPLSILWNCSPPLFTFFCSHPSCLDFWFLCSVAKEKPHFEKFVWHCCLFKSIFQLQ